MKNKSRQMSLCFSRRDSILLVSPANSEYSDSQSGATLHFKAFLRHFQSPSISVSVTWSFSGELARAAALPPRDEGLRTAAGPVRCFWSETSRRAVLLIHGAAVSRSAAVPVERLSSSFLHQCLPSAARHQRSRLFPCGFEM